MLSQKKKQVTIIQRSSVLSLETGESRDASTGNKPTKKSYKSKVVTLESREGLLPVKNIEGASEGLLVCFLAQGMIVWVFTSQPFVKFVYIIYFKFKMLAIFLKKLYILNLKMLSIF